MEHKRTMGFEVGASVVRNPSVIEGKTLRTQFHIECIDSNGQLKWTETFYNLVVNVGLDDSLDKHLKGSAYTAAFYVGLCSGTPSPAAGDTMASHAGWAEEVPYSQGTRPTLTLGAVSGQSVDNSGSPASFSITGSATVGGAFVVTDDTKGGSGGTLYGVGAFNEGNRAIVNGDTLNVTVTCTAAAS